jgi:hypothetical protein
MGINLYLIDQRSPRIFTMAFPESGRVNRILRIERPEMQPPLMRPTRGRTDSRWALFSLIGGADTMSCVVRCIMGQFNPGSLDLIRVEAHGRLPGAVGSANSVQFGARMEAADIECFSQIATLWSHPYTGSPASPTTPINRLSPRIEFHCCRIVPGCDAMLQALANASLAYVLASSADQDVDLRRGRDRYAMEPPVFRFDPGASGAQPV